MLHYLILTLIFLWPNNIKCIRASPYLPNNYLVCQDESPGLPNAHSHLWPHGYRPEHFESLTELCRSNPETVRRPGNVGCRCPRPDGPIFCDVRSLETGQRRGTTALFFSGLRQYCRRHCNCPFIAEDTRNYFSADTNSLGVSSSASHSIDDISSSTCGGECTGPNLGCIGRVGSCGYISSGGKNRQ
jgi:hypothetical protein